MFGDFPDLDEFKQYWTQQLATEYYWQAETMLKAAEEASLLPRETQWTFIQEAIVAMNKQLLIEQLYREHEMLFPFCKRS
jgi:hypothetical protein